MLSLKIIIQTFTFLLSSAQGLKDHDIGRLLDPPSRGSMWRLGFFAMRNEHDARANCGGFLRQWRLNRGGCGFCGDPFDLPQPRPHEEGGVFGRGIVTREYVEGQEIEIKIGLVANERGFFEIGLCPTPSQCENITSLTLAKDSKRFYLSSKEDQTLLNLKAILPQGFTCERCLLRWRYVTGNKLWPCLHNGTMNSDCGPQEEVRACADIRILPIVKVKVAIVSADGPAWRKGEYATPTSRQRSLEANDSYDLLGDNNAKEENKNSTEQNFVEEEREHVDPYQGENNFVEETTSPSVKALDKTKERSNSKFTQVVDDYNDMDKRNKTRSVNASFEAFNNKMMDKTDDEEFEAAPEAETKEQNAAIYMDEEIRHESLNVSLDAFNQTMDETENEEHGEVEAETNEKNTVPSKETTAVEDRLHMADEIKTESLDVSLEIFNETTDETENEEYGGSDAEMNEQNATLPPNKQGKINKNINSNLAENESTTVNPFEEKLSIDVTLEEKTEAFEKQQRSFDLTKDQQEMSKMIYPSQDRPSVAGQDSSLKKRKRRKKSNQRYRDDNEDLVERYILPPNSGSKTWPGRITTIIATAFQIKCSLFHIP